MIDRLLSGADPPERLAFVSATLPNGTLEDRLAESADDLLTVLRVAVTRWRAVTIEVDDVSALLEDLRAAFKAAEQAGQQPAVVRPKVPV